MKSDVIKIDNQGSGFKDALIQTEKAAAFNDLTKKRPCSSVCARRRC